jgi:predicted metal-dependent peptidase
VSVYVRPFTAEEQRTLVAARLIAVEHAPYLAHALFSVKAIAAEGLGTFAVDRGWRLYVDSALLAAWGAHLAGGVLVHEISHLVRAHAERADLLDAPHHHDRWNIAADAAINDDLLAGSIQLPPGVVTPAALGLEEGGIEEVYYAQLANRSIPSSTPAGDEGETGCGSGAGGPSAAWELPINDAVSPAVGEADVSMTRRRVAQAVREYAATRSRGSVPAGWQRWADATLAGPQVPWRRVLASAVRRAIAHVAGCSDYTYRRPGRRRIPKVITPAMQRPLITVAIVIDTSGSMGQAELDAALAEVRGVVRATGVGPRGLLVLACDAEVGAATRVRRASDIRLVGGGGTDMRVGIASAEAAHPRPDIVVVLTDGYTPWPEQPTRARLVVAVIGSEVGAQHAPEWATTVVVPAG